MKAYTGSMLKLRFTQKLICVLTILQTAHKGRPYKKRPAWNKRWNRKIMKIRGMADTKHDCSSNHLVIIDNPAVRSLDQPLVINRVNSLSNYIVYILKIHWL